MISYSERWASAKRWSTMRAALVAHHEAQHVPVGIVDARRERPASRHLPAAVDLAAAAAGEGERGGDQHVERGVPQLVLRLGREVAQHPVMAAEIADVPCRRRAGARQRGADIDEDADIELGPADALGLGEAEQAEIVQVALGLVGQAAQLLAGLGAGRQCRRKLVGARDHLLVAHIGERDALLGQDGRGRPGELLVHGHALCHSAAATREGSNAGMTSRAKACRLRTEALGSTSRMLVAPPASSSFRRAMISSGVPSNGRGVVLDAVGELVAGEIADHRQHALARGVGLGALAFAMDHLQGARRRHHAGMVRAAGLLALLLEERDAPDDLVGLGKLVEQQVIALARGAADAVGAAGGQPQRRVRALQRRWLDHDVVVAPALAVMAEASFAHPAFLDDLHRLVEALGRLLDRDAEAVELGLAVALADAEVDAPAAQKVERGDLLGHQDRIVPGHHHHRRAQPDVAGAGGEIGQHRHRGRDLALAGEMVLDHEKLLEAQAIGFDHIVDEALVALAVLQTDATLCPRAAEQSELHALVPPGTTLARTFIFLPRLTGEGGEGASRSRGAAGFRS